MNFKIIELSDPLWNDYINAAFEYDFHHTSCLHKIDLNEGEIAKLFVVEYNSDFVAYPLIIRRIPETEYFDITSVYGYCGPIYSKKISEISLELISFFKEKFLKFCEENKIVSVFSRLHPLMEIDDFFTDFGNLVDLNKTVAIDLTTSLEDQKRDYRKSNKSEINQLKKKKGYTIEVVDEEDSAKIQKFVDIYTETMERVEANDYYYFGFEYFHNLLNNNCFNCTLLVANKDGEMTAGAIFTETKTFMQYHLSGTKEAYINDTPMKLILDEARLMANENSLKYLHLGGGVGGSDDDSLFRFKSGFSKNFFQFKVWNLIVNQEIYNKLVNDKKINEDDYPNFFPLYRAT